MTEYIFDVPDFNQPIAGESALYYPDERDEPMAVGKEIIRCRDCKWFTPEHRYEEEREYGVMEELVEPPDCGNPERCSRHYDSITGKVVPVHIVTDPDGFCAWGERSEPIG